MRKGFSPDHMSCHAYTLTVEAHHIDFLGHVNNAHYLSWAQVVTLDYWQTYGTEEMLASRLWLAQSHAITYRRPAFLGDVLTVGISLQSVRGPWASFATSFARGADRLAQLESSWCCIDSSTHRPVRISEAIVEQFCGPNPSLEPRNLHRAPGLALQFDSCAGHQPTDYQALDTIVHRPLPTKAHCADVG